MYKANVKEKIPVFFSGIQGYLILCSIYCHYLGQQ